MSKKNIYKFYLSMKVNFKSNTSFGSIPIYNVKVRQKKGNEEKLIDATFSELTTDDAESIEKLAKNWKKKLSTCVYEDLSGTSNSTRNKNTGGSGLCDSWCDYYEPDEKFYAVELNGDEPLEERILAVCEFEDGHIPFLQSKPVSKAKREFFGAGAMLMYGLTRLQREKNHRVLYWSSTPEAVNFYKHIGDGLFKVVDSQDFYLFRSKYPAFIEKMENEYQLDVSV